MFEFVNFVSNDTFAAQYYVWCRIYLSAETGVKHEIYKTPGENKHFIYDVAYIYHCTINQARIKSFYINNQLHNEHSPALIEYNSDNTISRVEYWKNHKYHNEHGPAIVIYSSNGEISYIGHYMKHRHIAR
jgi:antitoxin component YwqK of YwqJK toxin-antitoxin module